MRTDQKILELVSDCKEALDNESFAYAKHAVFGMAPLLVEAVEQLLGQRKDAYAQTDKIHGENLGLHITLTQIRDAIGATKDWNNAEWSTLPGLVKKALEKSVPEYAKLAHANHALNERNEQQLKEIVLSRNAIAELKAQLTVAERISNDRNEARCAAIATTNGYIGTIFDIRRALGSVHGQDTATEAKAIREERDLLRLKLDTQTKIAVACQEAVGRATREQVERMKAIREGKLAERVSRVSFDAQIQDPDIARIVGNWESYHERFKASAIIGAQAILADLAQMPIELTSVEEMTSLIKSEMHVSGWSWDTIAIGICGMLRNRIAPLLAAHNATKIELPSIEEMHEQFDKGFEEAISETRGSNVYASDANGLRRVRDLIAARLGLTEQKPTKTEAALPVDKAQLDTAIGELLGRSKSKKQSIMNRFDSESSTGNYGDEHSVTLGDIRSLIRVLDVASVIDR